MYSNDVCLTHLSFSANVLNILVMLIVLSNKKLLHDCNFDLLLSSAVSVSGQLSAHILSPQCNSGNERRTNLLRLLRFVRQLIYEFNLFATAYLSLLRRNNFEHHSYCITYYRPRVRTIGHRTFSCYKLSASTTLLPVVARGLNVQFNALYHTFIDSMTYAQ